VIKSCRTELRQFSIMSQIRAVLMLAICLASERVYAKAIDDGDKLGQCKNEIETCSILHNTCSEDRDCPDDQKCCNVLCSRDFGFRQCRDPEPVQTPQFTTEATTFICPNYTGAICPDGVDFEPTCSDDSDCHESTCCDMPCIGKQCVSQGPVQTPPLTTEATTFICPNYTGAICPDGVDYEPTCTDDSDCHESTCCDMPCLGKQCVSQGPVLTQRLTTEATTAGPFGFPIYTGVICPGGITYESLCDDDSDCSGTKCCDMPCVGKQCMSPGGPHDILVKDVPVTPAN